MLPIEWKEMFKANTEVHKWLGKPLRLTKSLYGDRVANLAWDETQSNWMTSPEIGFQRIPSERSIYVKKTMEGMMMVLNAVDDLLYFATTIEMKDWFEKETERRFDVQKKLGQAEWYLQSRITQLADYFLESRRMNTVASCSSSTFFNDGSYEFVHQDNITETTTNPTIVPIVS
ncbi:reverse transcriptase RNA-dependent DNA polymerase [Nitzschia inconspicua]|uniref:Reverse transcriptase RNA-dependent DNA polymerase n=1 Tax=Nitzschia inconspicua TaxID=303405 RepID=A0A9K3PQ19_9STRA|nr:reverse transcriptase RNA-dependent DNA polymerase [Nitzschia inconspicua]